MGKTDAGAGKDKSPGADSRADGNSRVRRWLAAMIFVCLLLLRAGAQEQTPAAILGTVRDAVGAAIGDVHVRLERGGAVVAETQTTATGDFVLSSIAPGAYVLIADKAGLQSARSSITVDGSASQSVKLTMQSVGGMEFADEPNFTIAAVTDWTAAGGHGSDTVLRASEALNREAIRLKPQTNNAPPNADTEESRQRENALRAAVAQSPKSYEANHDLGEFYLSAGRAGEAVAWLEEAHHLRPDDFRCELDLARALQGAAEFASAREHVKSLMARGENADVDRLAGELDEKLGDPLTAVGEFARAVRADPSEQNYFEWGSELLLHRALLQAKEVFAAGMKAHPKSERMQTALGAALFADALYDQAAERLCAASDMDPGDPEPYLFMGRIVVAVSSPMPCVVPHLKRFAERQPSNAMASYYYAMGMWKQSGQPVDPAGAAPVEALLRRAVSVDDRCAVAWMQLGVLSYSRKDFRTAIDFFQRATAANPELSEAHYRLGMAYDRVGERDEAKAELDLHEKIDQEQKVQIERQRRAIKQFRVEDAGMPPSGSNP
jgi:tetratricopeptide (TPR) repeat protein